MAIYAEESASSFTQLETGSYPARCFQIVELGTIEEEYQGQKKRQKKVMLSFELPTELEEFKKGEGLKPRTLSKEFALSMHEKSTLFATIKAWFGKAPSAEQVKRFDVTQLLGKACMINVEHTNAGKPKIGTIAQVPKGFTIPDAIQKQVVLSYDQWDEVLFQNLPAFIQNRIKESEEFKKMTAPAKTAIPTPQPVVGDDEADLPEFLRAS